MHFVLDCLSLMNIIITCFQVLLEKFQFLFSVVSVLIEECCHICFDGALFNAFVCV